MKKEIKSWLSGDVLYSAEAKDIKELLRKAIKSRVSLRGADLRGVDLSGVDLSGADLHRAKLVGAKLSGADMSSANLSGADLSGANLSNTNLTGAKLCCASLYCADLSHATLCRANLYCAYLYRANLYCADLSHATLCRATLSCANLYGAKLDKKYSFLSISPIGSENGCLWTFRGEDGVLKLNRGCFSGTLPEFVEAVKKKHSGTKYKRQYMAAIELIKTVLGVDDNGDKIEVSDEK